MLYSNKYAIISDVLRISHKRIPIRSAVIDKDSSLSYQPQRSGLRLKFFPIFFFVYSTFVSPFLGTPLNLCGVLIDALLISFLFIMWITMCLKKYWACFLYTTPVFNNHLKHVKKWISRCSPKWSSPVLKEEWNGAAPREGEKDRTIGGKGDTWTSAAWSLSH